MWFQLGAPSCLAGAHMTFSGGGHIYSYEVSENPHKQMFKDSDKHAPNDSQETRKQGK